MSSSVVLSKIYCSIALGSGYVNPILLIDVSLLNDLGLIAALIISIACFFNFILGFNKETKVKDDSRSYAITGLMALWIIITVVASIIVGATLVDGMVEQSNNLTDFTDFWNS